MRVLVSLCLAAALLSAPASSEEKARGSLATYLKGSKPPTRTITDDNGGLLDAYWKQVQAAAHVKEKISFDGTCRSACTLFLALPQKQLCATPRVQFWFHKPFGGSPEDDDLNAEWMLRVYPDWVRDWIIDHGGLKKEWMMMDRYVILAHMRKC